MGIITVDNQTYILSIMSTALILIFLATILLLAGCCINKLIRLMLKVVKVNVSNFNKIRVLFLMSVIIWAPKLALIL